MANYLSKHPTELQGAAIKAETLWNERFTVNSVVSLNAVLVNKKATSAATSEQRKPARSVNESNTLNRINAAKSKQPIRTRDKRNSRDSSESHCSDSARKGKMDRSPSIKLLNGELLPASYSADKLIQKVLGLVKKYYNTGVTRLPSLWRKKFHSFSLEEKEFLYMDNRLVIPQSMRAMIMCSLHYGHPGRDAMLGNIVDIWWPLIHREVLDQARLCEQCLQSGKKLKCMLKQSQIGKITEVNVQNQEVALDFAGLFPNAKKGKNYLLVSLYHFSG